MQSKAHLALKETRLYSRSRWDSSPILFASGINWLAVAMQPGGAKDPHQNDLIDLLVKPPNADDDLDQSKNQILNR